MGIGGQKCGTTWLYQWLRRHPQISFPQKEIHFWDSQRSKGVQAYRDLFNGRDHEGDITPAYGHLGIDVIRDIREHFPDLRLIYLVRNPMERAWSAAVMAMRRADLTFEDASDAWFIDHFKSRGSLARGDYETCIRNWRSIFADQLQVFFLDDIIAEPREILAQCFQHIGVVPDPAHVFSADEMSVPVFSGRSGGVRPSLREPLRSLYGDKIKAFERYIGRDLSSWLTS